ncbi:SDR family NAD(P)-dependent oxidoreductase [Marinobacter sp. X15-166B]|uniref:SDR family NAD(P)-dependent oxidoreductase n=1 Tax=Marinobacter sp. X15-166B TaxID=1897620 RepID=UPI00085CA99B|nr:SDR family NAD(P)-dependent oxidoreductase [Marinobacter sp. X15-166B]OEY66048.1 short-chain dehydrogenase [Marinobacter sp. X15-166B]
MPDLPPSTAIVTGAGSGIGRAVAQRLALEGHDIVVVDRTAECAQETVRLLTDAGYTARAVVMDITNEADTQALISETENLRVLVNNAGIFNTRDFDELTTDDLRTMNEVNLVAMFTLCQQASRVLPEGGRIVNLASRAAFGARNCAHYVASKAGVVGLTKALALELAENHITVNAIAPGVIATDMLLERAEGLEGLRVQQPTGKLGTPEHIAHAVAFFVDARADYITGQILVVDGGRSVGGSATF